MKKLLLLLIPLVLGYSSHGQETTSKDESRLNFSANLQSNHLWRGLVITDKPVVTGQIWYDLNKSKTLQLGIWGASAVSNDSDGTFYKEINYYLQYSNKGFTIGLWDLYNSRNINTAIASDDIFDYSKTKTAHILDLRTSYQFQNNFPLKIEADVLLYGGANAGEVLLNSTGAYDKNRYSTYLELSYPAIRNETVNLNAFLGAGFAFNPGDPDIGQTTFLYGNGENDFDVVNIGFTASKNINIFNNAIPVSMTTMWNPSQKFARVQLAVKLF